MANIKGIAVGAIMSIIAVIIILQLVSSVAPDLQAAGNNLSATTLPLANLFSSSGIVMLIVVVGILVTVIGLSLKAGK